MERQKMKKKGFTLVELLVVIAIIAMLLAILMPALGKVRQMAQRLICGTNLSGIGKAIMVYSNDFDEDYPQFGNSNTVWAPTAGGVPWDTIDIDFTTDATVANATVTASLYLLVKFADVSPGQFICGGSDAKKFELTTTANALTTPGTAATDATNITDCWDFGGVSGADGPWNHCSYSYQLPYPVSGGTTGNCWPANATSPAGMALASDMTPWMDGSVTTTDQDLTDFLAINTAAGLENNAEMKKGNARAHQGDGQNVLFNDSHVKFEKLTNVGIERDNIYTPWNPTTDATGLYKQIGLDPDDPGTGSKEPQDAEDNYLVSDEGR